MDSSLVVPTFPALQERYNATYAEINYTVAIPALALAVSPLFWTPFASIYGRRIVFIVGCALAFAATIGSAVATTYSGYMATRFLQGWGVGPASTVGLQMLEDIYSEFERGEKVGYWTASIDLGKCLHAYVARTDCGIARRIAVWPTCWGICGHSFIRVASLVDCHSIWNASRGYGGIPTGNRTRQKRGCRENAIYQL